MYKYYFIFYKIYFNFLSILFNIGIDKRLKGSLK